MVQSLAWNDENNTLAVMTDGKLIVFFYPNVAYIDRSLLSRTTFEKDSSYVLSDLSLIEICLA
jgi:intraflagellar transport protein 80